MSRIIGIAILSILVSILEGEERNEGNQVFEL